MILITTKKGTKGRAKATLKIDGGFSNAAVEFRPTLNGEQRRELIYEGLMNFQQDEIAKNPEAGLASPTEYADLHINDYASIPELGYTDSVSYTHLDVYKRQAMVFLILFIQVIASAVY